MFGILLGLVMVLTSTTGQEIITSPPATNWGTWGAFEHCPNNTYVKAFQLKTESWKGPLIDDTASDAIRLFCGDPSNPNTTTIMSSEGSWGKWGSIFACGDGGYIYGFQLRVEHNGIDDETATNNVRMFCTNEIDKHLEGDGLSFGTWAGETRCAKTQALCGIQTQVQKDQGIALDDTALNNIAAMCCDLPR